MEKFIAPAIKVLAGIVVGFTATRLYYWRKEKKALSAKA